MSTLDDWQRLGSGPLGPRYDRALAMAAEHHRAQLRKGSRVPYLSHLLSVSALVLEQGGSEDQAIAGLLHDAVEDAPEGRGPAVLADIEAQFGPAVVAMVAACSDNPNDGSGELPWRQRKEAYVATLATKREDALLVTACDKVHNGSRIAADAATYGPEFFTRFAGGRDGLRWYYAACRDAIAARMPGAPVVRQLDRVVEDLGQNSS
ncbi:HD domain-containing protein [Klenkia marina]|uniref:HD domain-containing protein n=1 Tax=Klenkia marina TaxID=1960309 RepID=A0A1G4YT05_9ACTN|nr:HD domain-containing protein [Klenkia marina]SCX56540.1 HD domain-containing protein [Klenkia marina]